MATNDDELKEESTTPEEEGDGALRNDYSDYGVSPFENLGKGLVSRIFGR